MDKVRICVSARVRIWSFRFGKFAIRKPKKGHINQNQNHTTILIYPLIIVFQLLCGNAKLSSSNLFYIYSFLNPHCKYSSICLFAFLNFQFDFRKVWMIVKGNKSARTNRIGNEWNGKVNELHLLKPKHKTTDKE